MKTTIYGLIKIKETNISIPDLMVSVFGEITPLKKPSKIPSGKALEVSGSISAEKRERISFGSALTGEKGDFQIEIDFHNFSYSKDNVNYQLYLGVYAPWGSQVNTKVGPKLENYLLEQIALHEKSYGEKESFIIQIEADILKKFNLIPQKQTPPSVDESVAGYVKKFKEQKEFQDKLRKELLPFRKANFEKRKKITEDARKFAKGLSAVPKEIRLSNSSNFAEKASDVKPKMREAMKRNLNKWAEQSKTASGRKNMIALTDKDWEMAGMAGNYGLFSEFTEGTLNSFEICKLLSAKRGGVTLEKVRNLFDAIKNEKNNAPQSETSTPGAEVDTETIGDFMTSPKDVLQQKILQQISAIGASNGDVADWSALTEDEIRQKMQKYRISGDITENPSFHDFHHLQIAFQHVWMEAFDNDMRQDVEEIYKLYVELNEEYGVEHTPTTELFELYEVDRLISELKDLANNISPPSVEIISLLTYGGFPITTWAYLSEDQKSEVIHWTTMLKEDNAIPPPPPESHSPFALYVYNTMIRPHFLTPEGNLSRFERLRIELAKGLTEPYTFHYFAPNSVNFGILSTYRQQWTPLQYQVGDLVSTIPLAPGEKRKYDTKRTIKRTRAEKELDKALVSRTRESTSTQRADVEITARATMQSNFQLTAEGAFRFGLGEITARSEYNLQQSQESSQVKKDFREAVIKAAQEYRNEHFLEVSTSDEFTSEITSSGELSNPNNEITVTYLLYELERLYEISERLHRVIPVILVAQDVPAPNEITESWLLAHEWILRRVLLDDSLFPTLDFLTNAFAGEELSVSIKEANWKTQREIVEKLQATVDDLLKARQRFRSALITSEESRARAEAIEEAQGWLSSLLEELVMPIDVGEEREARLEARVKSIQKHLEYLEEGIGEKREELALAREALQEATKWYTNAIEVQTNRRVAIDQLRVHVKENILYYMQAIWDHEPPDQRYFRLYHIDVELPESAGRNCLLREATREEIEAHFPIYNVGEKLYVIESCDPPRLPVEGEADRDGDGTPDNVRQLVEIADLDHPLGYKGNYIIYPLKACTHLTNYMMQDFVNDYFGLQDPDETANYSADELAEYTKILADKGTLTEKQSEVLTQMLLDKINNPRRDSDMVIVPTGSLFIEALTGSHPLLEEFKMRHRKMDVEKVKAEVRAQELENLRRAARLLKVEPDLDDPDVDKHVVVKGDAAVHVAVP